MDNRCTFIFHARARHLFSRPSVITCLFYIVSAQAVAGSNATLIGKATHLAIIPLVVYLEQSPGSQIPRQGVASVARISSYNNQFLPAFQVIRKGGYVDIVNNDSLFHNTHLIEGDKTLFNIATPVKNRSVRKVLPRDGVFSIYCDLHPGMKAKIAEVTSQYYSVLWKPGNFEIRNIPPGDYKLHIWQSEGRVIVKPLTLLANEKKYVSLIN
ncbi:MAG: hypothetical protein ACC641_09170 [Acidiferrobacterales bacterium]